jgi:predicted nucleotidyltransferase
MNGNPDYRLEPEERRVVERLVPALERELGSALRGVWLYGSRARGEPPSDESDVDLIVVSTRATRRDHLRAIELVTEIALHEGANPGLFSIKLLEPGYIAERREIGSFFMREVDRDKVVLVGEP